MKKLVAVVLFVVLMVLAACTSGGAMSAPPQEISITATDIAYNSNRLEVVAGRPVQLTLINAGALEHDFSIMEMPMTGVAMAEEMAGHDMSGMGQEPEMHVAAAAAGGKNMIEFTPSVAGEYTYFCTVAGHKEAGMIGTLVVKAQ